MASKSGQEMLPQRSKPSKIKKKAALAAISRNNQNGLDWSLSDEAISGKKRQLATTGVYFVCPIVSNDILTKPEWKEKIKEYLKTLLSKNRGKAACLMIHTLNPDKTLVQYCIETITTYLNNIILNPDEDKYKKIRKDNKIFSTKVLPVEGALELLYDAGFVKKFINEDFLILEDFDLEHIQDLINMLKNTQPINLQVHRDTTVFLAEDAFNKVELPEDFYNRNDTMADLSVQLKTKAMRAKQEERSKRKYKYSLIRIRFPDNTFLQGTFGVYEKLKSVRDFIKDKLYKNGNFLLVNSLGRTLSESDDDKTLYDLNLLPAVLLTFIWGHNQTPQFFIKPRYLRKIKH